MKDKKEKPECTEDMLNLIIEHLKTASVTQMDSYVKEKISNANLNTLKEKYDIITWTCKQGFNGNTSTFIYQLCNLEYYQTP